MIGLISAGFTYDISRSPQDVRITINEDGSGSGASGNFTNLSELYDTNITSPSNNQVLTYNSTSKQWNNDNAASISDTNDSAYIASNLNDWLSTYNATYAANLDTNETTRFTALTNNCSAGQQMFGVQVNGTPVCTTDSGGAADGNASSICGDNTYLDGSGNCVSFNATVLSIGSLNSWNSTYNETYAGCVNNASYLSTYNATYAAGMTDTNDSAYIASNLNDWLSTYNVSYHGLINNASYLSTYNATYAANIDTNDSVYIAASENDWLSTYNATYAAGMNNCNSSGACAGGDVAYMDYANNGNYNVSGNLSIGTGSVLLDIYYNGSVALFDSLGNNAFFTDNVTADYFFGDGSQLTNLPSGSADGNASSICGDNTYLDGSGNCVTFNSTVVSIGSLNNWNSTYNETYAGCINNASYLSTYNATYASNIDTNDSVYIASNLNNWLSTYNATYAANLDTNDSAYIASNLNNWLSTYNATYAANLDTNDSTYIASNLNDWLSTYNVTYHGLIDNASYLSTYNATYAAQSGNSSWNQSYADSLYALNTTAGIQQLINSTHLNMTNLTIGGCSETWNGSCSIKTCPTTIAVQC